MEPGRGRVTRPSCPSAAPAARPRIRPSRPPGYPDRVDEVARPGLTGRRGHVVAYRPARQVQRAGDLGDRIALRGPGQHAQLPRAQRHRVGLHERGSQRGVDEPFPRGDLPDRPYEPPRRAVLVDVAARLGAERAVQLPGRAGRREHQDGDGGARTWWSARPSSARTAVVPGQSRSTTVTSGCNDSAWRAAARQPADVTSKGPSDLRRAASADLTRLTLCRTRTFVICALLGRRTNGTTGAPIRG